MLIDKTVKDFIDTTASGEPVPGGGSISALCGALATALGSMVARLTIGRKKYADREADMTLLLTRFSTVMTQLTAAIDRDSDAYATVMAAFRMPKDTEEQKQVRREAIEAATKGAAEVPMQVARLTASVLSEIDAVARFGNSNAITDAAVAAMCARTAVFGALLNVEINLSGLSDADYVAAMRLEAASLKTQAEDTERKILKYVSDQLNG